MGSDLSARNKQELDERGFTMTAIPLKRQKWGWYNRPKDGEIVTKVWLPADPKRIDYYQEKGFTFIGEELTDNTRVEQVSPPKGDFACSVCGKLFSKQQSLAGHMSKHNKTKGLSNGCKPKSNTRKGQALI